MAQSNKGETYDWVSLEGPFVAGDIRALDVHNRIEKLSLTKQNLVTAEIAKGLSSLQSVQWLWLWCAVTRTAMRNVISIPGLEVLDVLKIQHPGRLQNFASAGTLRVFRANHYMSESDLLEVSTLPVLEELGAQNSSITHRALDALLRIPSLKHLDLEATEFDDEMASAVARKRGITKLDIGATKLTREGLELICGMTQLRSLDIWATDIAESDLDLLSKLPNLECLSIGGIEEQTVLTPQGTLPRLQKLPSLRKLWLDGIPISEEEKRFLEQRYERVRIS